ncbi:porin family protein [Hymenobacter wooponensis]|uniref:PorT family protein n=1 Tax=Hymenobacter wooponensis TaxID=1525360 RepID=A0A4Z0MFU6_9BACT|nr:porin family protein [Hymenobacter wooponensis]TGD78247.1 PorT family protein [Hymenobacter wooponensis]
MKRIFLILLGTAGLAVGGYAQGARVGVKAGASLTNFVGKDSDGYDGKFGFHGGVVAELGLTDNFAIQPEVLYSMKGAKFGDLAEDLRFNQTYIDVPVLLKVKADGLFFEAGPQVGFLVGSKLKGESASVDSKDAFNKVDFGYAAGLGYEISNGPMIGLRYNAGINKVGKDANVNGVTFEAGEVRNSAFQLYLGFMFGGK